MYREAWNNFLLFCIPLLLCSNAKNQEGSPILSRDLISGRLPGASMLN